jgi:hypothetical protein
MVNLPFYIPRFAVEGPAGVPPPCRPACFLLALSGLAGALKVYRTVFLKLFELFFGKSVFYFASVDSDVRFPSLN